MSDLPQLSRRERQIMDIVYAHGEATASRVLAEMPDPLSRAASAHVSSDPRRQRAPGASASGREYVFRPTQARQQVGQSAFQRVLDVFFAGSLEQAVAAYLAGNEQGLDQGELEKMAELIRQARKQGR